jgi:NAD(P)-dependent dehydrogenase (short-subunit alcohol dehydrogenase family)
MASIAKSEQPVGREADADATLLAAAVSGAPVVLITGAAGGIGGATARRFVAGGWRVALADLADIDVTAWATAMSAEPSEHPHAGVTAIRADLRLVADCRRAVGEAAAWGGRLDAVVNAAGVWTEGAADETTEQEWDRVVDLNLKGLYFVCSAAIPHLERAGGGIVNLSSDAGVQGNAGAAVYCASKGGVSVLTKALALELAPRGVRVNAVCPGDVDTPMLRAQAEVHGNGDPAGYYRKLLSGYAQGPKARFIQPAEVAELIWFLCQPAAAPITGANVSIDFGLAAGIF